MTTHPRILVIDDNAAIHEDFRKILCPDATPSAVDALEASLFDSESTATKLPDFELEYASQGQEGLQKVTQAVADGRPYAMAFIDGRMPPGWDGIETIRHIWEKHPDLQVVICTAYSDYSWEEIVRRVGQSDGLVILKKPFDNVEVLQLAHALTRKWETNRATQKQIAELNQQVKQRDRQLQEVGGHLDTAHCRLHTATVQTQEIAHAGQADHQRNSALLAGMSHELRTPLNGVIGMTSVLLDSGLDKTQRDCAETIRLGGESLLTLLDSILEFSKIEAGQVQLKIAPFDLPALIGQTLHLLAPRAAEKGLAVKLEIESTAPRIVSGDALRWSQVLLQLVKNAIKFTAAGQVTVRVFCPEQDDASALVHVAVNDTGVGLAPDARQKIFNPFVAEAGLSQSKFTGAGLGLAIAKKLVDLMRGQIDFASIPRQGSTFWFATRLEKAGVRELATSSTEVEP